MLAARVAWTILESEHAHVRALLVEIASAVQGTDWSAAGPGLRRLLELILALEAFDGAAHRPKGSRMLAAMQGRSSAADDQLATLTRDRTVNDALLLELKAALERVAQGEARDAPACRSLLTRRREGLLARMERVETLLRSHAERLLTEEEWSHVDSEIPTRIERR